jgi:hypothetical protein
VQGTRLSGNLNSYIVKPVVELFSTTILLGFNFRCMTYKNINDNNIIELIINDKCICGQHGQSQTGVLRCAT